MSDFVRYVSVIPDVALDKVLDYGVTQELLTHLSKGSHVTVPLRGKPTSAYVLEVKESTSHPTVSAIQAVGEADEALPEQLMELASWMATYYCCSLSHILKFMRPKLISAANPKKERPSKKNNFSYFHSAPKTLNQQQQEALQKLQKSLRAATFETHLLYGITGSGKTEIYLQAIDYALKQERTVIILVPEISLTPQTIERFRSRLDAPFAVMHHRLTPKQRSQAWRQMRKGEVRVVIGARSAIFAPLPRVGLIIVDEEHEGSYKQSETMPCYNARDVAVMRGKMCAATVVLGSATPSLESYNNALKGKYTLSVLGQRAEVSHLPFIRIVDMRHEYEKAKSATPFSQHLLEAIDKRAGKGEQTILFLNRRGYHSLQMCQSCNHTMRCPACDVSLTYHLSEKRLSCHLCGYALVPPPTSCPSCGAQTLKFKGIGTELVERSLHAILPQVRTIRLDSDTTRTQGSQERLLREFRTGKGDVLIGTQMIAKGLHFPAVTLVGVLNSDASLHFPDFRAAEQTFQLLTQVSGRAGRGNIPGEVIIQTSLPEHPIIQKATAQDFLAFATEELEVRKTFSFPPFCHMTKLLFSGANEQRTLLYAEKWHAALTAQLSPPHALLHPLLPAGHPKIRDKYRFQLLIRSRSSSLATQAVQTIRAQMRPPSGISLLIDVDPLSTF